MEWLLPTGIAIAGLALTYFFCLRPMRNGHCGMMPAGTTRQRDVEVERLRAEVAELRASSQGESAGDEPASTTGVPIAITKTDAPPHAGRGCC